jgi:hypothetical protein
VPALCALHRRQKTHWPTTNAHNYTLKGIAPNYTLKGIAPNYTLKGIAPNYTLKGIAPNYTLKGIAPSHIWELSNLPPWHDC